MKRLIVSVISIFTFCAFALNASSAIAVDGPAGIDGPLANATVSFGQWLPPLDRLTANPVGGVGNVHELAPNVVTIKAGGAVNFVISGLHNVQVYGDGTQAVDIGMSPPTLPGNGGGIINDPTDRIYRGWDPNLVPNTFERDRVEVVHFANPGTYLVICGVRNHFVDDNMYGFVKVLPGK
jgi:plastocyanin